MRSLFSQVRLVMPLKPKSDAPTGIYEGESVDRYNFKPSLRRLLHEPEPAKRQRTPSQQSNQSPMKPKNADPKPGKADKATAKVIEQRDEARGQLKLVTAQLKRSQDSLQSANARIGSLETTVAKLKEKPLPQAKNTEANDLKDLVNKSTKQILEEIKSVRTSHVSLQEAVSSLANAPIEITQPAPVPPVSNRTPAPTAAPQRRPHMGDGGNPFQHVVSQSRDYHEVQPPRTHMDYWRSSVDDHYFEGNVGQVQYQSYAPDYTSQRQNPPPVAAPPQFQVRRVLPPGFGLPTAPITCETAEDEATSPTPAKKKRGRK